MGKCKSCGKTFHSCGSCGLAWYEWHYCNEKCRDAHLPTTAEMLRLQGFWNTLNAEQRSVQERTVKVGDYVDVNCEDCPGIGPGSVCAPKLQGKKCRISREHHWGPEFYWWVESWEMPDGYKRPGEYLCPASQLRVETT